MCPSGSLTACDRLCRRPAAKTSLDRVMHHNGEHDLIRYTQLGEHAPEVGVHGVWRDVQPLATAFLKQAVATRPHSPTPAQRPHIEGSCALVRGLKIAVPLTCH